MQSAESAKSADSPSGPIPPPLPPPTQRARPENPFATDACYELLRDESLPQQRRFIYRRTQPGPWPDAEGWETEALSLEDIFLAYAGMKVAEL